MRDPYPIIRPLLFRLPPETAAAFSIRALQWRLGRFAFGSATTADSPILRQRLWGHEFPNPLGLAAGFDKNALAPDEMLHFGFGFVEIGTVTPRPQSGNLRPRLFRLDEDQAAINRMGFNSRGLDAVTARLARRVRYGILGVNLGVNRDSRDAAEDYQQGIRSAASVADYLVVNVSSPNTPGLRDLQARAQLEALLHQLVETRDQTSSAPPLLLKIAPDLTAEECGDIAEVALATRIDGLIVSNTTTRRPPGLCSRHTDQAGGLSGRPLFAASTALLADMYRLTQGRLPLVGVGGVATADGAYAKILAGASLVQLYTALVFAGPALIGRINAGLSELLARDGFRSVSEAVGSDAKAVVKCAEARPHRVAERL